MPHLNLDARIEQQRAFACFGGKGSCSIVLEVVTAGAG